MSYYEKGDNEGAISDFSESLKLDSKNIKVWLLRGLAHYRLRSYDNAVRDFTEVIRLDPNDKRGYELRVLAYDKLEDSQSAESDRRRVKDLKRKKRSHSPRLSRQPFPGLL